MPEPPARSAQPASDSMPYSRPDDLAAVRAFVRSCSSALGLAARRVELLALAVSELATNTLQHTSGGGRVRVWADAGQLVCDVADAGPDRSFGEMPAAHAARGRGLAIVRRIADEVAAIAGPDGTTVRIRMDLNG
jgi:anti-sigma regulatory factor (Ser/Thr protein kinase)